MVERHAADGCHGGKPLLHQLPRCQPAAIFPDRGGRMNRLVSILEIGTRNSEWTSSRRRPRHFEHALICLVALFLFNGAARGAVMTNAAVLATKGKVEVS